MVREIVIAILFARSPLLMEWVEVLWFALADQRAALRVPALFFFTRSSESHKAYFGSLKSFQDFSEIDEVLVTYFSHGRSFTGEE